MDTTQPFILLVGNGRSLRDRPGLGAIIDRFPVVVRFNNFMTTGFEDYVGSKTDWWARNETGEIAPRSERFEKIIVRLQGEDGEEYENGTKFLIPELHQQYPHTLVEAIPRALFTRLIKQYGFVNAPLTGTMVIAHLLETHERVAVCGFDNLAGTPDSLRHYFSDTNVIDDWTTYHEPDKENIYLHELIAEGRVVCV